MPQPSYHMVHGSRLGLSRGLLGACDIVSRVGALQMQVMALKPSNQAQQCTSSCSLPQYTHKIQQELQSFQVDLKELDLLSPTARQDLEALQRSGLEKIHYRGFLVQVSEGGHLVPQRHVTPRERAILGVFCISPALSTPGAFSC